MSRYSDWFIPLKQEKNSIIRLFCFHHGGGNASTFKKWSQDLSNVVELIAVQLPGREGRFNEPLLYNLSEIIDNLCKNFDNYLEKPFIFFGHSVGALIAFEFARALRKTNTLQPKHLIASGTKAPQIPLKRQPISKLPDTAFIEELKKYNGMPENIINDKELMSIIMPIIRADFSIRETYDYQVEVPLNCPITAFGGYEDNTFDQNELFEWKKQTTKHFNTRFFPGGHFFINSSYNSIIKTINKMIYDESLAIMV